MHRHRDRPLAARVLQLVGRLRSRAGKLRELAALLEEKACALECAAMLEDERAVAGLEKWAQRSRVRALR